MHQDRTQLAYLKSKQLSETATMKLLSILKMLAQMHVFLGIIMVVMSALADYISSRINTVRFHGLLEVCSFYFVVMGIVALLGAASYRRGLVIATVVMSIHAILILVPGIVIVSSFDIHFFKHECYGACDWHLLSASLPDNSRCQILCGEIVDGHHKSMMTRLGTDYRLDAGIIGLAGAELLVAIASLVVSSRIICCEVIPDPPAVEMEPLNSEGKEMIEISTQ
ncbi:unnamed protein product, partial [Mesorhabditis spiculigera]